MTRRQVLASKCLPKKSKFAEVVVVECSCYCHRYALSATRRDTKVPRHHVTLLLGAMNPKPGPAIPPYRRRWRFDNTRKRAKVENIMASDFWAGYISGAIGIIIGNPLDVIKVQLQAGQAPAAGEAASASTASTTAATAVASQQSLSRFESASSLVRGSIAPQITNRHFPIMH